MEKKTEEKPMLKCSECKFTTKNSRNMERHNWTWHPSNKYERAWSKHALEGFMNWKGSSYYESYGPYY